MSWMNSGGPWGAGADPYWSPYGYQQPSVWTASPYPLGGYVADPSTPGSSMFVPQSQADDFSGAVDAQYQQTYTAAGMPVATSSASSVATPSVSYPTTGTTTPTTTPTSNTNEPQADVINGPTANPMPNPYGSDLISYGRYNQYGFPVTYPEQYNSPIWAPSISNYSNWSGIEKDVMGPGGDPEGWVDPFPDPVDPNYGYVLPPVVQLSGLYGNQTWNSGTTEDQWRAALDQLFPQGHPLSRKTGWNAATNW